MRTQWNATNKLGEVFWLDERMRPSIGSPHFAHKEIIRQDLIEYIQNKGTQYKQHNVWFDFCELFIHITTWIRLPIGQIVSVLLVMLPQWPEKYFQIEKRYELNRICSNIEAAEKKTLWIFLKQQRTPKRNLFLPFHCIYFEKYLKAATQSKEGGFIILFTSP